MRNADPAAQINQLHERALALFHSGRAGEAIKLVEQVLRPSQQLLGETHTAVGDGYHLLGRFNRSVGRYEESETFFRRALDVSRSVMREGDPRIAGDLSNLAGLLRVRGRYNEAEDLYLKALEVSRQAHGSDSIEAAQIENNLAVLYRVKARYAEAEPLCRHALDVRRQQLGEQHPDTARTMNNLGALSFAIGATEEAARLCRRALQIRRATLPHRHLDVAESLVGLAGALRRTGDNTREAETLYREALDIQEDLLGSDHPEAVTCKNNLAELLSDTGDFKQAEQLLRQALETIRCHHGDVHPRTRRALSNLAMLRFRLNDKEEASSLMEKAMEIAPDSPDHPSFLSMLNNYAVMQRERGNKKDAAEILAKIADTTRRLLGDSHPDLAVSINNLAIARQDQGDLVAAEDLFQEALDVWRKVFGENHAGVATALGNLAVLYEMLGDDHRAEPLFKQALTIRRRALGDMHPDVAGDLRNLASLFARSSRQDRALELMLEAARIDDHLIAHAFSLGAESVRAEFVEDLRPNMARLLSLVLDYFRDDPEKAAVALDLVLRRKGIGAEALAAQRDAVLGGQYPHLRDKFEKLTRLRRTIANKTLAGPDSASLEAAHQLRLNQLMMEKEVVETDLARCIPEIGLERRLRDADHKTVASALPEDSVLVEFVRTDVYHFRDRADIAHIQRRAIPSGRCKPHYLAFVLPAGAAERVSMIDMGRAELIEQMIAEVRRDIDAYGRELGLVEQTMMAERAEESMIALRRMLFDPLVPALDGASRLFVSADADLCRLPFGILPLDDGVRLLERYRLSYLNAGRDVLRFGRASMATTGAPLVAADPDFDLQVDNGLEVDSPESTPGRRSRALDRKHLNFRRLKGTRKEGEEIASILRVQPWLEGQVLEGRLKQCRSPSILHFATHGFFDEDQKREAPADDRGFRPLDSASGARHFSRAALDNPLLQSGLALAGANRRGALPAEAEDGILTAEDVSGLDLLGTELVVLSACETGLGEIRAGEGVFGLRRAFVIAGTRCLVMSLWQIEDQPTTELMVGFYRRLKQGDSCTEALRQAQLELASKYPNPFYWGAFICEGDPAPVCALKEETL